MFNLSSGELHEKQTIHTASEIYQQPEVWHETIKMIEREQGRLRGFVKSIFAKHESVRVILTGAGTSAFAGNTLVTELNRQYQGKIKFEAIATTDIVSNPESYLFKDVPTIMVSYARSGNSPESVASVALGEQIIDEFYQVVITCNEEGQLAQNIQSDDNSITLLMPKKSNDKSLAMTSSFSSMVLASFALFSEQPLSENKVNQSIQNTSVLLDSITDRIEDILTFPFERVIYLGSGLLSELSREGALKMLELTAGRVMAMHESSLGFRHGPKSVINKKSVAVLFMSEDPYTRKYDMDILRELAADDSGMKVIALTEKSDDTVAALADWVITVNPEGEDFENDMYLALQYIAFAQTFAMKKSLHVGLSPDNPSPDGVINRVVKGVTIYPFET
ncbi:SIS domain-containing protein [Lentibacillus sp. CBA3610]|uniref:SIS domain-containing protein n=1 Tax=Lentibacillus sp. CBA3610 TaxID=2518176 RepID=UPI001595BF6D|nr:SIS domain-containing protein [Lentibacillus sp. CBA3610]QKY70350.1 SIS domain-containing protein [Lentibacillus sp. CBA3610]